MAVDPTRDKVEVTPELKKLLARITNGHTLDIVENGVVVGRLERMQQRLPADESALAARQHRAMNQLLAELDALPDQPEPQDGLCGSLDHDRILYGDKE